MFDNGRFLLNICAITCPFLSLWEASMTQDARKDWRNLCREAVAERDPYKLIAIVDELNRELDDFSSQTSGDLPTNQTSESTGWIRTLSRSGSLVSTRTSAAAIPKRKAGYRRSLWSGCSPKL